MASPAARQKAVYRILLIHKDFEHCIELCQYIQVQMLDIEAGQFQRTATLPNLCVTQNRCLQTVAVDLGHFREVEYDKLSTILTALSLASAFIGEPRVDSESPVSSVLADRESESPLFRGE